MKRVSLVVVATLLCAGLDLGAQSAPEAIFFALGAPAAGQAAVSFPVSSKGVADRRIVGMHLNRLFDSGPTRLLLNVGGHRWVAVFERIDRDIAGHRVWVGSIDGVDQSHVSFAERDGVVSGIVNALSDVYVVTTVSPRVYALDRVSDRTTGELEPRIPTEAEHLATGSRADVASDDTSFMNNARNVLGADLVQLLQNSPSTSACGIGWLFSGFVDPTAFPAYSVADISAGCVYTTTHEMAHNMGSHHAPEDRAAGALYPYSYGYKDPDGNFRTVMAYACPTFCPRVPHLSNPTVLYNGRVTGTATQDNARSINEIALVVANFRQSATTVVTAPSAPTGLRSDVSGQNVTISWTPVLADSAWAASAATGYSIQVGNAPGVYNLLSNWFVGNTTAASGSAVPGTYYWRVIASNSAGSSPPSGEAQFTLVGCVPPGAPQNLTYGVGAGRTVALTWTAPSTGTAPFSYTIDVGSSPGLSNLLSASVGAVTALSVAAPAGTYYVRVRAANACATTSAVSNERLVVVP